MRVPNLSLRLLTTFVLLLLFAKLVENNTLFPKFDERHARKIQKIFLQKEQNVHGYMDMLERCIDAPDQEACRISFHTEHRNGLKKQGLYLFVYRNDTLDYWSTNEVTVTETYSKSDLDKPFVSLNNGRYASFVRKHGDYNIVGLILIKTVYLYENKYLQPSFQKDFKLPAVVKYSSQYVPDCYPINDSQGRFVWSLIFDSTCRYQYQIYVPAGAYLAAIFILFLLLNSVFQRLRNPTLKNIFLPLLAILLVSMRYTMQHYQFPTVFYELGLFEPVHFGTTWFPSFGELCLWCIFSCFFVLVLYRYLRFPLFYEHRGKYFAYVGMSLAVTIVSFFGISMLLRTLVIDSADIFEGPNRTFLLNGFSLLGYGVIMLYLLSFFLLLDKTLQLCKQELNFYQFLISYVIILSLAVIGWSLAGLKVSFSAIFFLSGMVYIMGALRLRKTVRFKYSHYVLIVFVAALYVSVYINRYSFLKYEDHKKTLVTNLAMQHDLTAEFFLIDISDRIIKDTLLAEIAYNYKFMKPGENDVLNYVTRKHFYSSYWNSYTFQCVVCADIDSLTVDNKREEPDCVGYFKRMIYNAGDEKLPRSEFYYINWMRSDATASYLGWFRKETETGPPLHIFIELRTSATTSNVLGYPELLLDSRTGKESNMNGYSYAKYNNNRRINQSGPYKYNLSGDIFQTDTSEYHTVRADGMDHLVYRPDKNNMIVLSSYSPKPGDLIINFSYIFIIFFVVVSLCLLIFYLPVIKRGFQWNFRNKIQYSMIAVLLFSFAIIGVWTVSYINRQYQNKNNDMLDEKMQAIHSELSETILMQKSLDKHRYENGDMLTGVLMYYRSIFFTDINIFDVNGQLIVTSLPDIFDRGLVGRQINPDAYIPLSFKKRASTLEHEDIGGLSYISAYEPFVDNENKVIAFLNLPYFTQQDALTEEISNVIITITNFYMVIILLTVIISIVVSDQITQPLIMLQDKFRSIRLGAKNEPVQYAGHDEIGGLVKEYNRAIDELARSATRLARSERESAWREMAKQIAHEINNPLTPMKLSIQHLKRAYDNKSERFDEYMEKISRSLVEQIDTLSSIATEFSNFAKMPAAQNQQIDLIAKINNVVPLFAVDENKRAFHTDFHGLTTASIYADKEQISRVFINLIKNALQAIPKDRQAEIYIDVLKINRILWVRIKDNGMGIPDEMQEKIFRPNFTTKSSGMGMGLAIVRNIIESAGGTINFKTKQGVGTTFIISLPSAD